ncbi:LexA family transcriptional regulator [Acinetobacter haemolyticus]|uniref:LexA family transcriptional regulator n=1 Tax=Acinetobacter haemolyticus TaxID=29430 RepID=UPI000E58A955|nr:LexA family transcriptional regulator [Acinetobacter haemolyticus]QDJ92719.1 LexA family transcriptional regulator [Acinetobacter haemolyticus]
MTELQTIHEIRLSNTRKLMNDLGLSRSEFADRIEMSYNLLSQYIGKNPTKNIGDETAEKIEKAFDKPKGFLDQSTDILIDAPSKDEAYMTSLRFKSSYENKNTISIPVHKNVKASCGDGVANYLDDITGYVEIDPNFLKMLGIRAKPEKLRVIYSTDYSMWPTVSPDSPLFVDVTPVDTSVLINGDVYVFLHSNFLRMKRIFISYGNEKTVRLQSDNPDKKKYPDEIITKEQLNELSFVGRLESALVKP